MSLKKIASPYAALLALLVSPALFAVTRVAVEAPVGFDNQTNGFVSQGQFDLDRATFDEREDVADGLGPVYNAQSCAECHQNPISGAGSQVTVLRAGRFDGRQYTDRPGGSLIHDRAIDPSLQERVSAQDNVRSFRASISTLGDGFIEAIADSTLEGIQANQPPPIRGTILRVPVGEAPGTTRIGRFGWKDQHASLVSFAADAYLNEMGITSPLQPTENSSNGNSVAAWDTVADPEEPATATDPDGTDVDAFARFMRATKAPSRDRTLAGSPDARGGEQLFRQIGCAGCHTPDLMTAPAGTVLNGGKLTVPPALGDKIIHPFSDFLLHDVGTGDGIVQNGGQASRNLVRTPPLWGLRTRNRLMHDGQTLTKNEAILRHRGQAQGTADRFQRLPMPQKNQLLAFLNSL